MPKFSVVVSRFKREYRTIIVDAHDEGQIVKHQEEVFDVANNLNTWLEDEDYHEDGGISIEECEEEQEEDMRL